MRVSGAKGKPPPPIYKACALELDGYRLMSLLLVTGRDAVGKAQRVGQTLFERMRHAFPERGWDDFRATSIELLGGESQFGPHSQAMGTREVVLKIAAHHDSREALAFFAREIPSSALSMAPSLIGGGTGLPRPTPYIRVHSLLVPRDLVTVMVDGAVFDGPWPETFASNNDNKEPSSFEELGSYAGANETVAVPLLEIAYGRSGDKGNICNVGIVARRPEFVPILRRELTAVKVKTYLSHLVKGQVERFELPGLNAFNFVLHEALGGGTASLRFDPLGKGMAQILLECLISVPMNLL